MLAVSKKNFFYYPSEKFITNIEMQKVWVPDVHTGMGEENEVLWKGACVPVLTSWFAP